MMTLVWWLLLFLMASPTMHAVTIKANAPPRGWQVLPGSQRRINAFIDGGTSNRVNWSVASAAGGATATLSATTNAIPTIDVTIGSSSGDCTVTGKMAVIQGTLLGSGAGSPVIADAGAGYPANTVIQGEFSDGAGHGATVDLQTNGSGNIVSAKATAPGTGYKYAPDPTQFRFSAGPYGVTSTASVTVEAQSVDDPSKEAQFHFDVCRPTTEVHVTPFYVTLYSGQHENFQSFVIGNSELGVRWSVVSQPQGGDAVMPDKEFRDVDFVANVAGRYTVRACSVADAKQCDDATVYVTGHPMPYSATANLTEPVDCTVDPALKGMVYDVGPTQKYKTMQSVPLHQWPAGSTLRLHNEDTTGSNPTTYHEYIQLAATGAKTQPVRLCGVPDAKGNLPVIDGADATGAPWVHYWAAAGWGGVTIFNSAGSGGWALNQGKGNGPWDVIVEGVKIQNVKPEFKFTPPTGGPPVAWGSTGAGGGVACVNIRSGYELVIRGNEMSNCGNGTFSSANTGNLWAAIVMFTDWQGNYIHGSGNPHSFTEHQLYIQGWGQLVQGNRIDLFTPKAEGSNLKSRGPLDVIRYNYLGDGPVADVGPTRQVDFTEVQDAQEYIDVDSYLGNGYGKYYCNNSKYCLELSRKEVMGVNKLAGWIEAYHSTSFYGNIIHNTTAQKIIHFSGDHGGNGADRMGTLYFYNNTLDGAQVLVDTLGAGGNDELYFEFPKFDVRNNILFATARDVDRFAFANATTFIANFGTNLMRAGSFSIQTPITPGNYNAGRSHGWGDNHTSAPFPLAVPLDGHITGLTPANFLTTGSQPYSDGTYAPTPGSAAINAGAALTGPAAQLPVRYQYTKSGLKPRKSPLTIGAVDPQ